MVLCLLSVTVSAHLIEVPQDETVALLEEQIYSLERTIACKQRDFKKCKECVVAQAKCHEITMRKIKRALAKLEDSEANSARKKALECALQVATQAHAQSLFECTRVQESGVDHALEAEQLQLLKSELATLQALLPQS